MGISSGPAAEGRTETLRLVGDIGGGGSRGGLHVAAVEDDTVMKDEPRIDKESPPDVIAAIEKIETGMKHALAQIQLMKDHHALPDSRRLQKKPPAQWTRADQRYIRWWNKTGKALTREATRLMVGLYQERDWLLARVDSEELGLEGTRRLQAILAALERLRA